MAHRWIFVNSNGFGFFREFPGAAMRPIRPQNRLDSAAKTADFGRKSDVWMRHLTHRATAQFGAAFSLVKMRHALGRRRPRKASLRGKLERFLTPFSLTPFSPCSPLGSTITTPPGRTPPWPISRPSPASANRRSLVRSTAPFLRPDLPSPTTGPPGRRQERHRRPAPAGAKRPCTDPPDRSRSNRRKPNARSPEQRSWKRQLGEPIRGPHSVAFESLFAIV